MSNGSILGGMQTMKQCASKSFGPESDAIDLKSRSCEGSQCETDSVDDASQFLHAYDPRKMLGELAGLGVSSPDAVTMVKSFYRLCGNNTAHEGSSVGSRTSRTRRLDEWRSRVGPLPLDVGQCYLHVVRWARREAYLARLGNTPSWRDFVSTLEEGDLDVEAAQRMSLYRMPTTVLGQVIYHVAEQCDDGERVGSVRACVAAMLRLYPFLNSCRSVCDMTDLTVDTIPLVGVVGLTGYDSFVKKSEVVLQSVVARDAGIDVRVLAFNPLEEFAAGATVVHGAISVRVDGSSLFRVPTSGVIVGLSGDSVSVNGSEYVLDDSCVLMFSGTVLVESQAPVSLYLVATERDVGLQRLWDEVYQPTRSDMLVNQLYELYNQDFTVCRCKVHEPPVTLSPAFADKGCCKRNVGKAGVVSQAAIGVKGACHASEATRLNDKALLRMVLYENDPGLLSGTARSSALRRLCTSSVSTVIQDFGNGYCYLEVVSKDLWWRVARLLGPNPLLLHLQRFLPWVGKAVGKRYLVVKVRNGYYHFVPGKVKGAFADATNDVMQQISGLLADESNVGARVA